MADGMEWKGAHTIARLDRIRVRGEDRFDRPRVHLLLSGVVEGKVPSIPLLLGGVRVNVKKRLDDSFWFVVEGGEVER